MHFFLFFYFLFYCFFLGWAGLNPAQHIYWWLGSAQPHRGWAQLSPTGAGLGPDSPARSLAQASDRLGKQLMHA